jgi:hypothetical protein
MKKQTNNTFMLGVLIGVIGLAVLVFGIYQYNTVRQSLGNALGKLFKGSSKQETLAIVEMIAGGGLALVGAFLAFARRKR